MPEIIRARRALLERIKDRSSLDDPVVFNQVLGIMGEMKSGGDKALRKFTKKFDGVSLENFVVKKEEIEVASGLIDDNLLKVIREAAANIKDFHEKQMSKGWMWQKSEGINLGQRITPMEVAGVYVPGGTAPLVSSVLMNVIPAKVAGVRKIVVCTPPLKPVLI